MNPGFLALPYEELKARRDALASSIARPFKDTTVTILIHDGRVPALCELDAALAIATEARRMLGPKS